MPEVRYNNAYGVLGTTLDAPAAGTSESITNLFTAAPNFATLEEGYFIKLCLDANTDNFEIVYLTSYTQGSKNGTITRGAEDATNWPPVAHSTTSTWGQNPAVESLGVQIVDLGLIELATLTSTGPQDLYAVPSGGYLSGIRFADDPATVAMDTGPYFSTNDSGGAAVIWVAFGTKKSFGWNGFAGLGAINNGLTPPTYDSLALPSSANGSATGINGGGYGPLAALDTGTADTRSLVLSAATVGPIQAALLGLDARVSPGGGVRIAAITAWAATTAYQSPASNTVATPGVLQRCAIVANGTIWINDGASGTSDGITPDFAGNAGGSIADGADIVWYDTSTAPPTVGAIHPVAEIWTPQ